MTKKLSYLLLFMEDNGLGIASVDRVGSKDVGNKYIHVYKIQNRNYDCRVIGKGKLCILPVTHLYYNNAC